MMSDLEPEADDIIGQYRRHALAWARERGDAMPERQWIDRFLAMVPEAGRVLDLGCGSGVPIAKYLIEQGRSVTGIDSSPEMIAMFKTNCPGQLALVEDMRSLLLIRTFDGLIAWDSFFHLSHAHQRSMFSIFQSHARHGAPLLFTTGYRHGEAAGTLEGEPLYHASLHSTEYALLLGNYGFHVVAYAERDSTAGGRSIWLARRR